MLIHRLKDHLRDYRLYSFASEIRSSLKEVAKRDKVVSLKTKTGKRGDVLFSYILDPFLLDPDQPIPNTHTHYWESWQMARTFLDFGYCVDAISYRNTTFVPRKEYALFVDARRNLQRLTPFLHRHCTKIMHIDAAHMLFHNAAESRRLLELQQRRGVTLRPRRFEIPNFGIEHADCATILGNEFTASTFTYAKKPLYRIPISAAVLCPWLEDKNWEECRTHFLWFGSGGLVHKGLDLVLEAFAAMPDYHLTICGPIQQETDFEAAFARELYHTPNIHTVGWVDISSALFLEILRKCGALIYPSCSEGGGGSVIQCMHGGLIPVVSYEASVDVHDFGLLLKSSSIADIQAAVHTIAGLSVQEFKGRARGAWEYARANHTKERFAEEYRKTIAAIIATHSPASTLM
jgi:glycosyltransferase involved in cell wall biosynthesis